MCAFVCAPSSVDTHVRSTLQQISDHNIELYDLPEVDIHKQCAEQSEKSDAQLVRFYTKFLSFSNKISVAYSAAYAVVTFSFGIRTHPKIT